MNNKKPFGRSLEDFKRLSVGEMKLLEACRRGVEAKLGGAVPLVPLSGLSVRASFLRFLLLGGDEQAPVHEHGVNLCGAFIEKKLDLNGCRITASVTLSNCSFPEGIEAADSQFNGLLNLQGSHLGMGLVAERAYFSSDVVLGKGFKSIGEVKLLAVQIGGSLECGGGNFSATGGPALSADGADIKDSVYLCDGFKATGEVRLVGVQIGGILDCNEGHFEVPKGCAFTGNRMTVKGSVFLTSGFTATGSVNLQGVQVGVDLACTGGHFEETKEYALSVDGGDINGSVLFSDGFESIGEVRLLNARIGVNLDCYGGHFEVAQGDALTLQSMIVRGVWHFHGTVKPVCVNAAHAEVAVLVDDLKAWAPGSTLDGFSYASFGGQAPTNGKDRLEWLDLQNELHSGSIGRGESFRPQPWHQLRRVLREMGHAEDAKLVGIAFENRRRDIGQLGHWPKDMCQVSAWLKCAVVRSAHYIFGLLAGYGYRPIRLVGWMFAVWFLFGVAYWWLALPPRNAMAPSDPLVFQNWKYEECLPDRVDEKNRPIPGNWYLCAPLRGEYATFSPFAFSLDLMLPVVDLGLEKTWGAFIPSPKEKPMQELLMHWRWGHIARLLTWIEILFGWLCSLLLVGIVSGYSRRSEEG